MSEHDPVAIRIVADAPNNEWFDDEEFTHAPNDTLYIRRDRIIEYLAAEGYQVTIKKVS